MEKYKDIDNDSSIKNFDIGKNFIIVEFKYGEGKFYEYTYETAGIDNVEKMKKLAKSGNGLNAFININKPGFSPNM